MQKYFVKHKLSVGDIGYLSDSDSRNIIEQKLLNIEDLVEIETYEKKFLAQITDIKPNSVEIEVVEDLGEREVEYIPDITIIQSLSNETKFNYFIEKSVEIGIERIIPIESKYSLKNIKQANKDYTYWNKLIKDATEQSRSILPTIMEKPIHISELKKTNLLENSIRICLTTEINNVQYLHNFLKDIDVSKPICIAIGPEKGWDSSDINVFKNLHFNFVKLKGNILRTETTGLVIGSIIRYIKDEI